MDKKYPDNLIPTDTDTQSMRDYKLYGQSLIDVKNACSMLWGAVNVMSTRLDNVMHNDKQEHESTKRFLANVFGDSIPDEDKDELKKKPVEVKTVGKYRSKLNPTDRAVLREISRGHYVAIPTIAGSIGRKRGTVSESIKVLRNLNYDIITKDINQAGRSYRTIYKLNERKENA